MILQANTNSYTTFMGWYGSCEQDCEPYDLTSEPKIFSVYQFSEDGTGVTTYLQNSAPFLQSFTTLECGKAYWIVLYPNEDSQSSTVNIPHFVGSNNTNNDFGYITNNCNILPTPTPVQQSTPTPEKTNFTSSPNGWFNYEIINTSGDTEYSKSKYKQVFHDAFNKWDEVITSAPGGWNLSVTIDFQVMDDDILGGAYPTMIARTGDDFFFGQTFVTDGKFMLNTKNMSSMYNNITDDGKNEMYYVSLHEIGHIIGIGYITFMGEMVLQKPIVNYTDENDGTQKSYYTGVNATREYKNYFPQFASGILGVPVEDDGGTGTAMAHPEEGLMGVISRNDRFINGNFHPGLETELMSGWSDAGFGKSLPMSRITIGFLDDMGFGVDYSKADNYDITNFAPPEAPVDDTPNFDPTPTPITTSSKKKILALHGGGGSSYGLSSQPGMSALVSDLSSDFEFIYADAPNNLWIQDPPGGKDNPTTDPNWANDTITFIDNLVDSVGPFYGILGYSQGAAFIPVYLANSSNNFNLVLMYNGYLPYTHQGLMDTINSVAPFNVPSVVFSGEYDTGFKDMAPDLASKFSNCLYVRSSSAGHHLPYSNDPTYNQILNYINAVETTTSSYTADSAFLSYDGEEADRNSREVIGGDDGSTALYCKVSSAIENVDGVNKLVVRSNGVPNYTPKVGSTIIQGSWSDELSVSSDRNPNMIGEQDYVFTIPLIDVTINPVNSESDDINNVTETALSAIGVSSNGVPIFNPWHNNQGEFLASSRDAITFATFSSCCGHPSGAGPGRTGAGPYHYHKYPTCIAGNRGLSPTSDIIEEQDMADVLDEKLTKTGAEGHSPVLGYMIDGYPVYGPIGTTETTLTSSTPMKVLKSSFVLNGDVYEYVRGNGDLDKCNAIYSATPEYPNGCYHYVLSIDSNSDGTVKRTENPLYIYRDGDSAEQKLIITPMYPHTTVYYRGTEFGSFSNGDGPTSIDPNDDPCSGFGVTWGPGVGPPPEGCNQQPPQ